jgi:hypothetical protein
MSFANAASTEISCPGRASDTDGPAPRQGAAQLLSCRSNCQISFDEKWRHMNGYRMRKIQRVMATLVSVMALSQSPSIVRSEPLGAGSTGHRLLKMDQARYAQWQLRWEQYIINDARNRYCDKEMGEEIGWLVTPFLAGFYYGYLATGNTKWVEMLLDWADSWIKRAVKEPDGYRGWPKSGAAGTSVDNLDRFYADSLLGEAMALRPVVLMSNEILRTPALKEKYGAKAVTYIELSEEVFKKWDGRGAWRHTDSGEIITIVAPFGIDGKTGTWTDGYERRYAPDIGFSHQANKANLIASWLLAMFDATHKPEFKERAEKWFRLMKSRMKPTSDGTYRIWNYWQPAGAWDYKASGMPKHWIGIHPNPAYYDIDVEAIVAAYGHDVVFTREDVSRLISTSLAEKRYWTALVPYDLATRKRFEDGHKPDSWNGLVVTPWYLALQRQLNGDAVEPSASTQTNR